MSGVVFDMNSHQATYRFAVYVKRLDKELQVTELKVLTSKYRNHLWGFAEDEQGNLFEFDVTWGDVIRQKTEAGDV
jgi:hypothetical protein